MYFRDIYPHGKDEACPNARHGCTVCAMRDLVEAYWFKSYRPTGEKLSSPTPALNRLNAAMLKDIHPEDPMYDDFQQRAQSDPYVFLTFLKSKYISAEEVLETERALAASEGDCEDESDDLSWSELFDIKLEERIFTPDSSPKGRNSWTEEG